MAAQEIIDKRLAEFEYWEPIETLDEISSGSFNDLRFSREKHALDRNVRG